MGVSAAAAAAVACCPTRIRNVAIIAHVDHGKTTLVDRLLATSAALDAQARGELDAFIASSEDRLLDSGDLEKERGITIVSKVTRLDWRGQTINVVDTPGHADFGGEVERILSMVDGVVLVCDATEGPMAQTKFVLGKALDAGKAPLVVLNKADRPTARLGGETESELFDLFASLGADDDQLDYPTLFASATQGWSTDDAGEAAAWALDGSLPRAAHGALGMATLLDAIVAHVDPACEEGEGGAAKLIAAPFAMAVNNVGKCNFLGRLATGRVESGALHAADQCGALLRDGAPTPEDSPFLDPKGHRVTGIFVNRGTARVPLGDGVAAGAGDIVTVAGVECAVGDTLTTLRGGVARPLVTPPLAPPTLSMTIGANTSPFAGSCGSARVKDRLLFETDNNVTIDVKTMGERCEVFARGELQLGILIEQMRREGLELSVSPPKVVVKDGMEPWEEVRFVVVV